MSTHYQLSKSFNFNQRDEKLKHKKRMRKLESLYRQNLRRMRKTLEVKLEKSAVALEEQREERKRKIST